MKAYARLSLAAVMAAFVSGPLLAMSPPLVLTSLAGPDRAAPLSSDDDDDDDDDDMEDPALVKQREDAAAEKARQEDALRRGEKPGDAAAIEACLAARDGSDPGEFGSEDPLRACNSLVTEAEGSISDDCVFFQTVVVGLSEESAKTMCGITFFSESEAAKREKLLVQVADPDASLDTVEDMTTQDGCMAGAAALGLSTGDAALGCFSRLTIIDERNKAAGASCSEGAIVPSDPARGTVMLAALLAPNCPPAAETGTGSAPGQMSAEDIKKKQAEMLKEFDNASRGTADAQAQHDALAAQQAEAAERARVAAAQQQSNQVACAGLKTAIKAEFQRMFTSQFNEAELIRLNNEAVRLNCQIDPATL